MNLGTQIQVRTWIYQSTQMVTLMLLDCQKVGLKISKIMFLFFTFLNSLVQHRQLELDNMINTYTL